MGGTYTRWVKAWLVNRVARVRVEESLSRARTFKEGVPHCSVLPPLLFVLFVHDLLGGFEKGILVSAYADDLALAISDRDKNSVARMQ